MTTLAAALHNYLSFFLSRIDDLCHVPGLCARSINHGLDHDMSFAGTSIDSPAQAFHKAACCFFHATPSSLHSKSAAWLVHQTAQAAFGTAALARESGKCFHFVFDHQRACTLLLTTCQLFGRRRLEPQTRRGHKYGHGCNGHDTLHNQVERPKRL